MATLYTEQEKNVRNTWILITLFLAVVIGLGWFFSYYFQSPSILVIAVVIALGMNIFAYWNADKLALRSVRAVPADEHTFKDLHRMVENLAITAGIPKPRVYIIPDASPNAFATGRDAKHAAVAFTTGILEILEPAELEGVVAHELAHIGNRDILLSTMVIVLVGFISLISDIALRSFIWGGDNRDRGGAIAIVGLILAILAPISAVLIQLAISRKREYLADATGALLTRYPEGLARALEKISSVNRPMQRASDATAHMFIANPFGSAQNSFIHKMFRTHPPTGDRINRLRAHQ
jgi:heat shock protein HtpX